MTTERQETIQSGNLALPKVNQPEIIGDVPGIQFNMVHIPVQGLTSHIDSKTGEIVSNIGDEKILRQIVEDQNHNWIQDLAESPFADRIKLAIGVGAITMIAGLAYEVGVRHGEDIRKINDIIQDYLKRKRDQSTE